jgi:hypothetical protein
MHLYTYITCIVLRCAVNTFYLHNYIAFVNMCFCEYMFTECIHVFVYIGRGAVFGDLSLDGDKVRAPLPPLTLIPYDLPLALHP